MMEKYFLLYEEVVKTGQLSEPLLLHDESNENSFKAYLKKVAGVLIRGLMRE